MPHQHVHNLTPYPHSAEGSAFPFPTIPAKQSPMQLQPQRTPSSSSSTSSSYASFRYPTPHAQSYPSASFPLKLSTIHSPVPPSLLQRRRSSCCTVSSMDSLGSASTTSTSSWGNWSVDSPVPGLSRSGSSSSRTGAGVGEDLKTPETVLFGDFEDEISHNGKLNAEQRQEEQEGEEEDEDFALSHSGLVSAMKTKKSTMARPRLFVKLAEPEQKTGPRLQRTQTPLELWTMRSQRSAPVQEEEMEEEEEEEEMEEGGGGEGGDLGVSDVGEEGERDLGKDSIFDVGKKRKKGLRGKRLRVAGAKVLEMRDAVMRREEKRREREWSREVGAMEDEMERKDKELRMKKQLMEKEEGVYEKEMELLELQIAREKRDYEKRIRLERELDQERRQRMKMEEKWEEEELEWRERLVEVQIEHEKQMMQMHADACQNQLQILGVLARLVCQFFGSTSDGLNSSMGTLPPQVLQNLQHPGELGDGGKPDANLPSEFL